MSVHVRLNPKNLKYNTKSNKEEENGHSLIGSAM
jgi:hypothetical protein